jgi:hypothetical protein
VSRALNPTHLPRRGGIADIGQDCQLAQPGDSLAQKCEPLAVSLGLLDRQARDVAARARKTGDEPGANRIVPQD